MLKLPWWLLLKLLVKIEKRRMSVSCGTGFYFGIGVDDEMISRLSGTGILELSIAALDTRRYELPPNSNGTSQLKGNPGP